MKEHAGLKDAMVKALKDDMDTTILLSNGRSTSLNPTSTAQRTNAAPQVMGSSVSVNNPTTSANPERQPEVLESATSLPSVILDPLRQIKAETELLNVINANHSAKKTRIKQKKEDDFEADIAKARNQLAGQDPLPLGNRPYYLFTGETINNDELPPVLHEDVVNISRMTGWDETSTLLCVLGALSISLWGRYIVRVDNGWDESVSTYLFIVSPSGSMKSFLVKLLKVALIDFIQGQVEEFKHIIPILKSKERLQKKAISRVENIAIKEIIAKYGSDYLAIYTECQRQAVACAAIFDLDDIPHEPPTLLSDTVTPKKLAKIMAANGNVGAVFEAEEGFFTGTFKGEPSDLKLFLNANGMEDFVYSTCSNETRLSKPVLNIINVVQPVVFGKLVLTRMGV